MRVCLEWVRQIIEKRVLRVSRKNNHVIGAGFFERVIMPLAIGFDVLWVQRGEVRILVGIVFSHGVASYLVVGSGGDLYEFQSIGNLGIIDSPVGAGSREGRAS